MFILKIAVGCLISLSIGFIVSTNISFSCEYHEPISKELTGVLGFFFDMESNHPESNGYFWLVTLLSGIPIGLSVFKLYVKLQEN